MTPKSSPVCWTRERIREQAQALSAAIAERRAERTPATRDKETREALSPFWAWRVMRHR